MCGAECLRCAKEVPEGLQTIEDRMTDISAEVVDELIKAVSMFPPMAREYEGYAVILEELDELWTEIKANKVPGVKQRMRKEAIQVAAMAMRFVLDVCDSPRKE